MKTLVKLLIIITIFVFVGKTQATEATATATLWTATQETLVYETKWLYSSIADSNIEGTTIALIGCPVVSFAVVNNTTATAAGNQGAAIPNGCYIEWRGAPSVQSPTYAYRALRRVNGTVHNFGNDYQLDTRGIGVLRPVIISSVTPSVSIGIYARYSKSSFPYVDGFSDRYKGSQ